MKKRYHTIYLGMKRVLAANTVQSWIEGFQIEIAKIKGLSLLRIIQPKMRSAEQEMLHKANSFEIEGRFEKENL